MKFLKKMMQVGLAVFFFGLLATSTVFADTTGGQFVDKHALAVNVNRLRAKLEDEQHRYISNVYGVGYQWIG